MTLSIRLEPKLEQQLAAYSVETGKNKSEIVKQALTNFLAKEVPTKSSYELGKDLFGKYGSGKSDLATRHSEYLKIILQAKHKRDIDKFNRATRNRRHRTARRPV